jgi:hypothetical protein
LLLVATDPDPERERKIADEKQCLWLLAGYLVDAGKYGKVGFPKKGGPDEWAARAAAARLIRDHIKGFTAELLALAIDPRTPSHNPLLKRPIRVIRFDKPRGKPPTVMRNFHVIDFIRKQCSLGKEDAALLEAEREFHLGKSRTHAIWAAYKQLLAEYHLPLEQKQKPARRRASRSTK